MFEIFVFVICSVISGVVAGAFGLGGGAILVPMLIFLLPMFGVDGSIVHIAIATSLSCIIFTAISSSRSHYKRGGVDFSILKTWAPLNFIGAIAGAFWTTG
ncbi:MAG: TSUP family transporter, partial [Alphaproteobacteria bacterium]